MREVRGIAPRPDGVTWAGSTLIDVAAPDPDAIATSDIALALARAPRFGGRTRRDLPSYSVAWHSLFCEAVADLMGLPAWVRMQCLLHDAPEYILGDMASPVKSLCPDYRGLESGLWAAVAKRYLVPVEFHPAVHAIDRIAFGQEAHHLLGPNTWDPVPMPVPDPEWSEMAGKWMVFALRWREPVGRGDFKLDGREVFAAGLFEAKVDALAEFMAHDFQGVATYTSRGVGS